MDAQKVQAEVGVELVKARDANADPHKRIDMTVKSMNISRARSMHLSRGRMPL